MIETVIAPIVGAGIVVATVLAALYRRPRPVAVPQAARSLRS